MWLLLVVLARAFFVWFLIFRSLAAIVDDCPMRHKLRHVQIFENQKLYCRRPNKRSGIWDRESRPWTMDHDGTKDPKTIQLRSSEPKASNPHQNWLLLLLLLLNAGLYFLSHGPCRISPIIARKVKTPPPSTNSIKHIKNTRVVIIVIPETTSLLLTSTPLSCRMVVRRKRRVIISTILITAITAQWQQQQQLLLEQEESSPNNHSRRGIVAKRRTSTARLG
jgi:hypothetical protein